MRFSNWILLAALYVSQFLPVAFFFMGLPVILRDQGMALEQIGALYGLGLVWVLKFIWAPWLDRIRFGRFGHYRVWLLLMQGGIVVVLALISQLDGVAQFPRMLALALVMTAMAATQDIAADATACRLLPPHLRGTGNAIQIAGGVLGLVLGGGGMILVYNALGWQSSLLFMAAAMLSVMVPILIYREEPACAPEASRPVGMSRLWRIWTESGMGVWALALIVLNIGVSMVFPMLQTGLVDAGWQVARVGIMLNVIAPLASLAAVALTGLVLVSVPPMRVVLVVLPLEALATLALLPLAAGQGGHPLVIPAIVAVYCAHHSISTAVVTIIMSRTSPGSEGSDFSVQHSLFLLTGFVAGGVAMQLAGAFGYGPTYGIAAAVMLAAFAFCLIQRRRLSGWRTATGPVEEPALWPEDVEAVNPH